MFDSRFARALSGAALLAAGACAGPDAVAPLEPGPRAAAFDAAGAAGEPTQKIQLAAAPGLCLAVKSGQASANDLVVLATCADVPAQLWTVSVGGAFAPAKAFDGAQCMNAWGGAMRAGDRVGTWSCSGVQWEQWTLNASGELRLPNGLCAGLAGSAVAGTPLTLQGCDGSAAQKWTAAAPGGRVDGRVVNTPSGMCADVSGATRTAGGAVILWACSGAANQTWSLPPAGSTGEVRVYGSLCLDAFGGGQRDGDLLGTWSCHGGANQQWRATAAGELRSPAGLCVGVTTGSPQQGSRLVLQGCSGAAGQKWTTPGAAAVPPSPAPPPAPRPTPTGAEAVFAFAGRVPSVASQVARGGAWARYENDFSSYAELHWQWEGADNFNANYYDRAMIYYVWWARTGNGAYLDRANQLAVNHRTYLEQGGFRPQPYNAMIDGVAMHAVLNNDARSAAAVSAVNDFFSTPGTWWYNSIGDTLHSEIDPRSTARVINTAVDAWYVTPAGPARDALAARLRAVLGKTLNSQRPNGAYPSPGQCMDDKPFMSGMVNDALVRYYTLFEADARIVATVKRSVDYLWARAWVPESNAFRYLVVPCNGEGNGPTADLSGLIVSGYAFVGKQTGDASYFAKGDAAFAGGVNGAWLTGTKQFNQQYTTSYRYLGMRF